MWDGLSFTIQSAFYWYYTISVCIKSGWFCIHRDFSPNFQLSNIIPYYIAYHHYHHQHRWTKTNARELSLRKLNCIAIDYKFGAHFYFHSWLDRYKNLLTEMNFYVCACNICIYELDSHYSEFHGFKWNNNKSHGDYKYRCVNIYFALKRKPFLGECNYFRFKLVLFLFLHFISFWFVPGRMLTLMQWRIWLKWIGSILHFKFKKEIFCVTNEFKRINFIFHEI